MKKSYDFQESDLPLLPVTTTFKGWQAVRMGGNGLSKLWQFRKNIVDKVKASFAAFKNEAANAPVSITPKEMDTIVANANKIFDKMETNEQFIAKVTNDVNERTYNKKDMDAMALAYAENKKYIERFKKLGERPEFAKLVKELIYRVSPDIFEKYNLSMDDNAEAVEAAPENNVSEPVVEEPIRPVNIIPTYQADPTQTVAPVTPVTPEAPATSEIPVAEESQPVAAEEQVAENPEIAPVESAAPEVTATIEANIGDKVQVDLSGLKEKLDRAQEQEARIVDLTTENEKLKSDVNERDQKMSALVPQVQQLTTENEELTRKNNEQATDIEQMKNDIESLKTTVQSQAELEQKLKETQEMYDKLNKEHEETGQEMNKLRFSQQEFPKMFEELKKDNTAIGQERDYYKNTLISVVTELKEKYGIDISASSVAPQTPTVEENTSRQMQ